MMLDYLPDPFSMTVKYSYLLKPDGNVILAKYFDGSVSAGVFKYEGDSGVVVKIDADYIEFASNKSYCDDYIEIIDDIKCIKGSTIKGSWSKVVKASKALKELIASDSSYKYGLNENNGYIEVTFSKLDSEMMTDPYNMGTDKAYKFIFNLEPKEYIKQ